jgi:hypothetical protein
MTVSRPQAPDDTCEESVSLEDDTGHDTRKVVGEKIADGCVRTHPETQHCIDAPYSDT